MHRLIALCCCLAITACKSPLADLKPGENGPSIRLAAVTIEDHSRQLKRLKRITPGEANTPAARHAALEDQRQWFQETFAAEGAQCGIRFSDDAPIRLELTVTDLGEVRTKYIVYGIASGVAWGVGTGLLAHNTSLALGLGGYELLEESAFWIGGSAMFSSFSAPAVVEARLFREGETRPLWKETYFSLSGRGWIKELPERSDRGVQLRASLQKDILKILRDLEDIPGYPKDTRQRLTHPSGERTLQERIVSAATDPGR